MGHKDVYKHDQVVMGFSVSSLVVLLKTVVKETVGLHTFSV